MQTVLFHPGHLFLLSCLALDVASHVLFGHFHRHVFFVVVVGFGCFLANRLSSPKPWVMLSALAPQAFSRLGCQADAPRHLGGTTSKGSQDAQVAGRGLKPAGGGRTRGKQGR